jgi:hypothetical protein
MSEPLVKAYKRSLELVGGLTVALTLVEWQMKKFIFHLSCPQDHTLGRIMTANLGFRGLKDVLMSLYRYKSHDSHKTVELEKLLSKLKRCERKRNEFVHGIVVLDKTAETLLLFKDSMNFNEGFIETSKTHRVKDVEQTIEQIHSITSKLENMLKEQEEYELLTKERLKSLRAIMAARKK